MNFDVFYYFSRTGAEVSSAKPVSMSIRDILDKLLPLFEGEDDYLGLIDSRESMLQILYLPEERRCQVELLDPRGTVLIQMRVGLQAVEQLLERLPGTFHRDILESLPTA